MTVYDALAMAFQSTIPKPGFNERARGVQWTSDVKAVIRAIRSRDPRFDAERFFTLTGFTAEHKDRWGVE